MFPGPLIAQGKFEIRSQKWPLVQGCKPPSLSQRNPLAVSDGPCSSSGLRIIVSTLPCLSGCKTKENSCPGPPGSAPLPFFSLLSLSLELLHLSPCFLTPHFLHHLHRLSVSQRKTGALFFFVVVVLFFMATKCPA